MKTEIAPMLHDRVASYIFVALLAPEIVTATEAAQDRLSEKFPGALWLPRGRELHITVLHVISPDRQYHERQDVMYARDESRILAAFREAVAGVGKIQLEFSEVGVSQQAVVIKWRDGGAFEAVRSGFISRYELPTESRRPPEIVHTTIARYVRPLDLAAVEQSAAGVKVGARPVVDEMVLAHETTNYMQDYEVLERFPLAG